MNLSAIDQVRLREELMDLSVDVLEAYAARIQWLRSARKAQLTPAGDWWNIWMAMAGRGWGKTAVGAGETWWYAYKHPGQRCHVIAPTHGDLRGVCFEGESGLINKIPTSIMEDYNTSLSQITLKNGSIIKGFSASDPNRMRGPQCHFLWGDEVAAWDYAQESFDMAMMGLRLGTHPRAILTTTPKPIELIRTLTKRKDVVVTHGTTYDNRDNLAASFFDQIKQYEGTVLGRQELDGILIDPEEAGIIKRSWIKMWEAKKPLPKFEHLYMSIDTAFTDETIDKKSKDPDYSAVSVWGVFNNFDTKRLEIMLLDCWQEKIGLHDFEEKVIKELAYHYGEADKPLVSPLVGPPVAEGQGRKVDTIVIEDQGAGKPLRYRLAKIGIPAYAYNPGKADKLARLHLVSPFFKMGQVWMPESDKRPGQLRTWTEPLVAQLCAFPHVKHDDLMDTATQVLRVASDMQLLKSTKPVTVYVDELPRTKRPREAVYG